MNEGDILRIFTRIVQNALRDDGIVLSTQTTAREVKGWDSLKQVLIIMEVEEKFGITLHSREIDGIMCVGDFVAVIGRKTRRQIDPGADLPPSSVTEAPR
jgi:acyl carrier protein